MSAGQGLDRDETGLGDGHHDQLRNPVSDSYRIGHCAVGVEECDPDLAPVAGIHRSRAVYDRQAVARRKATSRHDEGDKTVGKGDGNTGTHGRPGTRLQDESLGRGKIGTGIPRVGVSRNTRLRVAGWSPARGQEREENVDVFWHVTRVVQIIWSNRVMQTYRERLWPTPWVFLSTALVIPASLLVFLPINVLAGIITAVILYGGVVLTLVATAPIISVEDGVLTAGRARVPIGFTANVEIFEGAAATLERGQRLDARAWLVIRGWISPVVRVSISDQTDPAPYWLLSTRRPAQLREAIVSAQSDAARNRGSEGGAHITE